jgi:hypothetical protein
MPATPLLFERIELIAVEDRPRRWLQQTPVARIILWPGEWGTQPGLLRLTPQTWVMLTPKQIFACDFIAWPDAHGPIAGFYIRGTTVDIVVK